MLKAPSQPSAFKFVCSKIRNEKKKEILLKVKFLPNVCVSVFLFSRSYIQLDLKPVFMCTFFSIRFIFHFQFSIFYRLVSVNLPEEKKKHENIGKPLCIDYAVCMCVCFI